MRFGSSLVLAWRSASTSISANDSATAATTMTVGTNQKLEFRRSHNAVTRVIENEAAMGNSCVGVMWLG
jgi:hypothetical protein